MHLAAVFAFVIGALIGLYMAVNHFRGVDSGMAFGIVHGLFTVSGIVLLGVGLAYAPALDAWPALWAFLATASGGLFLFYRQMTGKKWPSAVVLIHGGAAIASIAFLLALIWGDNGASRQSEPGVPAATSAADGGGE